MSQGSRAGGAAAWPASETRRCLLIRCGDPEPAVARDHGCFAAWFRKALDGRIELDVVDVRTDSLGPDRLEGVGAVLVSGSPHSVTEPHPWLPDLVALVREAVLKRRLPFLGVCFGHQVLALACGGVVDRNPRGREMGTIEVTLNPDGRRSPLFEALPDRFRAQATHCDTVLRPPPGATVLATSERDACQAFALGSAWGVQFHPEVTADVLRGYVQARAERLRAEGIDPVALHASIREVGTGRRVLDNFVALAYGLDALDAESVAATG